jgi:hypothetical protein
MYFLLDDGSLINIRQWMQGCILLFVCYCLEDGKEKSGLAQDWAWLVLMQC